MKNKNNIELTNSIISVVFDLRNNKGVSIMDKRSNHLWRQGDGLFVLEVYDVSGDRVCQHDFRTENVAVLGIRANTLRLMITHEVSGISVLAEFTINQDRFTLRIPINHVMESKKSLFRLKSIAFNPNGFCAKTGEEGCLLLPCYSGIQCSLKHSEPRQLRSLFYVQQSQWENINVMPILGMVHKTSAFLAIVESGDFDAEIVASVCWGKEKLNSIRPCFNYRYSAHDQLDQVDRIVTYHFLVGAEAGYVGMAKRYREYLMKSKGILSLRDKIGISPQAAYVYDAYSYIKIFLAMNQIQPDGSVQHRVFTTFDETVRIMERFKKEGIEKARFILVGWNWEGHDGRYPTRFPVDQRVGGQEGLRRVVAAARDLNYQITFHDNYSDAYRNSPDWDEAHMIKDRNGKLFAGGVWAGGQSYFLCPYEATKRFICRDLPKIENLGLNGWYYLDAAPRALRGCYDPTHNHPLTRRAEAEGMLDQFRTVRAFFGGSSSEMPTAFVLPEVDEVSHIPCLGLWRVDSELKHFADEVVPFFHFAIHGLVLYHIMHWPAFPRLFGSIMHGILKEAEYGALPRAEVTCRPLGPQPHPDIRECHEHFPWVKKEYDLICQKLGYLQLEFIQDHRKVASGVFETTYSDGSRVIVNYCKGSYSAKHVQVGPLSCELIRG